MKKQKLLFSLMLLGLFILYWGYHEVPLLWDDYELFKLSPILEASNPFAYWFKDSEFSKAWPLSYSSFWVLNKFNFTNLGVLRFFGIFVHCLNALLFCVLLEKFNMRYARWFAILFVFHPLHVETLFWIIQLNTLLAVSFFLISSIFLVPYFDKPKIKIYVYSLLAFFFSVAAKPVAILTWLNFFAFKYSFQKRMTYRILLFLPMLFIAVYFTQKSFIGIQTSSLETSRAQNYLTKNEQLQEIDFMSTKESESEDLFFASISYMRVGAAINSFFFYTSRTFVPETPYIFYPKSVVNDFSKSHTLAMGAAIILLLCGLFVFSYWMKRGAAVRFFTISILAGFLPVSTLFYIPYMKYSLVSAHWGYIIVLCFSGLIASLIDPYMQMLRMRFLSMICIVLLIVITFQSARDFRNTEIILSKNMITNSDSPITYRLAAHYYSIIGQLEKASELKKKSEIMSPLQNILNEETKSKPVETTY